MMKLKRVMVNMIIPIMIVITMVGMIIKEVNQTVPQEDVMLVPFGSQKEMALVLASLLNLKSLMQSEQLLYVLPCYSVSLQECSSLLSLGTKIVFLSKQKKEHEKNVKQLGKRISRVQASQFLQNIPCVVKIHKQMNPPLKS